MTDKDEVVYQKVHRLVYGPLMGIEEARRVEENKRIRLEKEKVAED